MENYSSKESKVVIFHICILLYEINQILQVNVSSQHLSRSTFSTRSDIIITILLLEILNIPNIAFLTDMKAINKYLQS